MKKSPCEASPVPFLLRPSDFRKVSSHVQRVRPPEQQLPPQLSASLLLRVSVALRPQLPSEVIRQVQLQPRPLAGAFQLPLIVILIVRPQPLPPI